MGSVVGMIFGGDEAERHRVKGRPLQAIENQSRQPCRETDDALKPDRLLGARHKPHQPIVMEV